MIAQLSSSSISAQNSTSGTDFWLTFGQLYNFAPPYNWYELVNFQIRIVNGNAPTEGTIYFTNLDTHVDFSIPAHQVYDYTLNETEKVAVYNATMGVSNKSIHITTDHQVSVSAFICEMVFGQSGDATNVLPSTTLGMDYYDLSYAAAGTGSYDAYVVVAIEDNTHVYHNGILAATLNEGGVYYRTSPEFSDMTGTHITSDKPIALFAATQVTVIPVPSGAGSLFQQLAPVHTWGRDFFVPVSHLGKDVVRIVASEDGTNITQTGGTMLFPAGGQTSLDNLQAGQFVEL